MRLWKPRQGPWLGVYQHADGGWYLTFGLVDDATNGRARALMVLYFSLRKWLTHVRTLAEWDSPHSSGRKRFTRVWAFDVLALGALLAFAIYLGRGSIFR